MATMTQRSRIAGWPERVTIGPATTIWWPGRPLRALCNDVAVAVFDAVPFEGDLWRYCPYTESNVTFDLERSLNQRCRASMRAAGSRVVMGWGAPFERL